MSTAVTEEGNLLYAVQMITGARIKLGLQESPELDVDIGQQNYAAAVLRIGEPGTEWTVAVRRFVEQFNSEHYRNCYLLLSTVIVLDAYGQLNSALGGTGARSKS